MCVLYVNDVGGILTLVFEEDGELCFEVTSEDFDPTFDDIGSHLKIKQIQRESRICLEALQLYYRVFFSGRGDRIDAVSYRCWKYKHYIRSI